MKNQDLIDQLNRARTDLDFAMEYITGSDIEEPPSHATDLFDALYEAEIALSDICRMLIKDGTQRHLGSARRGAGAG